MLLSLEDDSRPPYRQAAEALRTAIVEGELPPGARLPSARRLQSDFGISSSTVQNALRVLKREGLVYSVVGRGSYVREHPAAQVSQAPSGQETPSAALARAGGETVVADDPRLPYVQVADILRVEIQAGHFGPGSRLPSARELQGRFGIANSTAQNAIRVLKAEGLVYAVKGKGAFVRTSSVTSSPPGSLQPSPASAATAPGACAWPDRELALALNAAEQRLERAFAEYQAAITGYQALARRARSRDTGRRTA